MIQISASATRRLSAAIYAQPRGGLKAAMTRALRQSKPARGRRRTTLAGSSMVPESLRIIHRPEEIEARIVPGHWEGDLIKGAFNRSSLVHCFAMHCRQVIARQSPRGGHAG